MKALVYHGPGQKQWEEVAKPTLRDDTDAIVRVDAVTICGTDLHILKGDVPSPDREIAGCPFRTRCPKAFDRCATEVPLLAEYRPGHLAACHLHDS